MFPTDRQMKCIPRIPSPFHAGGNNKYQLQQVELLYLEIPECDLG